VSGADDFLGAQLLDETIGRLRVRCHGAAGPHAKDMGADPGDLLVDELGAASRSGRPYVLGTIVVRQAERTPLALILGALPPEAAPIEPTALDGAALIAEERARQRRKWSDRHDDDHDDGSLAAAAAVLAAGHLSRIEIDHDFAADEPGSENDEPFWGDVLLSQHARDRVRQLTIAGALLAAEIDRLKRAERA
jgi:hypothetical protein